LPLDPAADSSTCSLRENPRKTNPVRSATRYTKSHQVPRSASFSSNWRGQPLRDYETIVGLIASTTTAKGLKVTCRLDRRKYATGRKVTDAEVQALRLQRDSFHGEWNYTIKPRKQ